VLNNLKVPSFFDQFKIRSDFTEHPKQNNKDLTSSFGGQFDPAVDIQASPVRVGS
jgi:hypothetical protein